MTEEQKPLPVSTVNLDAKDSCWDRAEKIWSLSGASGKLPADVVKAIALYMELDANAVKLSHEDTIDNPNYDMAEAHQMANAEEGITEGAATEAGITK